MEFDGGVLGCVFDLPAGWWSRSLVEPPLPFDEAAQAWIDERGEAFRTDISAAGSTAAQVRERLARMGMPIDDADILETTSSVDEEGKTWWRFELINLIRDATPTGAFDYLAGEAVTYQQDERRPERLVIEAELSDYDGWELGVELLLRFAATVAAGGGSGHGSILGCGDAVWHGAGYVGVLVRDGAMEAYLEDELQNLDLARARTMVPPGMLDFPESV